MWFSEAAGNRIGRIDDGRQGHRISDPEPGQPAARHVPRIRTARSGSSQTSTNALGRIDRDGGITEHKVTTPNASLRGVCVGPDGDLWFTENFANKIGRMAPDGTMLGEYDIPTPDSDARCIARDVGWPVLLHAMRRRADRRSHPSSNGNTFGRNRDSRTIRLSGGNVKAQGALVWNEKISGKRPLLLVMPNWLGVTEHRDQARAEDGRRQVHRASSPTCTAKARPAKARRPRRNG